jgi:hypothetical protein
MTAAAAITQAIARSAEIFASHWPAIAARCPDLRLADASLFQLEGRDDDWARDEDRRHGTDAIATTRNGLQTRLATRTQTVGFGERYATITLRDRELPKIADGTYTADLHAQTYGDEHHLVRVVVVQYTAQLREHLDYVADDDRRWRACRDRDGRPYRMLLVDVDTLRALRALVWHWHGLPIDLTEKGHRMDPDRAATPGTDLAHPAPPAAPEKSAMARHYNDLWALARLTTNTEMVPKALRGRPDAALAVMVYGSELGLSPMTALREVYIIEGTPSCSAKLMRALILRAGHQLEWRVLTRDRAVLTGRRRDRRGHATVEWTLDDARAAGVASKDVWKRYPRSMLAARATSELARLIFPDVTIGYTPEELGGSVQHFGEYDTIDVEPDDLPGHVDYDTGEILDTVDVNVDERPAHQLAADMFDAEDAQDAEWLRQARDADDQATALAEQEDDDGPT